MRRALPALGIIAIAVAAAPALAAEDAGAEIADAGAQLADAGAESPDGGAALADAGTGSADAGTGSADAGAESTITTCVEHVPRSAARVTMKEDFATRGRSGYAAELRVVITHGRGATVLPDGVQFKASSDAARGLNKAGFTIPDPEGGVAPTIKVASAEGGLMETTLTIPVVPLPEKPGRNVLTLPPLPVAISRANNEYITLCTRPHTIVVDDPIANELDPKVKPNPPARPQREDWPLARNLAIGIPIGVALALLGLWLLHAYRRRPRVEPERPKIPPWIVALGELEELRQSDLLERGRTGEYFDRVSDSIRKYLGGRYGFEAMDQGYNGLEMTTGEMLDVLRRVRPPITELYGIKQFLDECDLVKFARLEPTSEMCLTALSRGEQIVQKTIPVMKSAEPTEAAS